MIIAWCQILVVYKVIENFLKVIEYRAVCEHTLSWMKKIQKLTCVSYLDCSLHILASQKTLLHLLNHQAQQISPFLLQKIVILKEVWNPLSTTFMINPTFLLKLHW